jgi:hypothetical protein
MKTVNTVNNMWDRVVDNHEKAVNHFLALGQLATGLSTIAFRQKIPTTRRIYKIVFGFLHLLLALVDKAAAVNGINIEAVASFAECPNPKQLIQFSITLVKLAVKVAVLAFWYLFETIKNEIFNLPRLFNLGFIRRDIPAEDDIMLRALVFDPNPCNANEKNPCVIFISSWGMNRWEYEAPARRLAEKGYTIVSYTARGFWCSGGDIDLAGSKDVADLRTVIDWVLANTHADPERIGLSGISYGGGEIIMCRGFN